MIVGIPLGLLVGWAIGSRQLEGAARVAIAIGAALIFHIVIIFGFGVLAPVLSDDPPLGRMPPGTSISAGFMLGLILGLPMGSSRRRTTESSLESSKSAERNAPESDTASADEPRKPAPRQFSPTPQIAPPMEYAPESVQRPTPAGAAEVTTHGSRPAESQKPPTRLGQPLLSLGDPAAVARPDESDLAAYDEVAAELAREERRPGLWLKALAVAHGDEGVALAHYARWRAGEIAEAKLRAQSETLISASSRGDCATIEQALVDGADVNFARSDGSTPLYLAVLSGQLDAVRLLLSAGADKEARNRRGLTALDAAINHERHDMLEVLDESLERVARLGGAPPNVVIGARKAARMLGDGPSAEISVLARKYLAVLEGKTDQVSSVIVQALTWVTTNARSHEEAILDAIDKAKDLEGRAVALDDAAYAAYWRKKANWLQDSGRKYSREAQEAIAEIEESWHSQ